MEDLIGRACVSKAGHDKEEFFLIISQEPNFVYLTDGKLRNLENPKKKKIKHVMLLDDKSSEIKSKLENSEKVTNLEIREFLEEVSKNF